MSGTSGTETVINLNQRVNNIKSSEIEDDEQSIDMGDIFKSDKGLFSIDR